MRIIFLAVALITFILSLKSQSLSLNVVKNKSGLSCVVLLDEDTKIVIDTIVKYAYEVEIIHFLILNKSKVMYISEDNVAFFYQNFDKLNGKWTQTLTSGALLGNNKLISFKDPKLDWRPKTFKILKEDLVSIKRGDEETIKDCNEIRKERDAWIKGEYSKYLDSLIIKKN